MADIFVRSADGNNADDGSTWALAKATAAGAAAIDAAGDRVFFDSAHSEVTAGAVILAWAGTDQSPVQLLSVDSTGNPAPPTALAAGALIGTSGANTLAVNGALYANGMTFRASDGSGGANLQLQQAGQNRQAYKSCTLHLNSNNSANTIQVNVGQGGTIVFNDSEFKFNNAGHGVAFASGRAYINGGGVASGSVALTGGIFRALNTGRGHYLEVAGFDFSNAGSAFSLFAATSVGTLVHGSVRNCRLPASWSGSLVTGTISVGERYEMHNCDNADTNYRLWVETYTGSIKHETTIVRTGGASDGDTPLSWKMASSANAEFPHLTLESPEIVKHNSSTGSPITVAVEVVHDSQGSGASNALTDKEAWLEVQYLGTSGVPLGSFVSDVAGVLASAADQASSSEAWTTTGLTTPVKQKLSVTFTPQEKGYIHAKVHLAKASATAYVDPKLAVS